VLESKPTNPKPGALGMLWSGCFLILVEFTFRDMGRKFARNKVRPKKGNGRFRKQIRSNILDPGKHSHSLGGPAGPYSGFENVSLFRTNCAPSPAPTEESSEDVSDCGFFIEESSSEADLDSGECSSDVCEIDSLPEAFVGPKDSVGLTPVQMCRKSCHLIYVSEVGI